MERVVGAWLFAVLILGACHKKVVPVAACGPVPEPFRATYVPKGATAPVPVLGSGIGPISVTGPRSLADLRAALWCRFDALHYCFGGAGGSVKIVVAPSGSYTLGRVALRGQTVSPDVAECVQRGLDGVRFTEADAEATVLVRPPAP